MFADTIQSKGPLSMETTKNLMSESMELMPLVSDEKMEKKVYDRVCYLKKKDLPSKLEAIQEVPAEERTQAWVSNENDYSSITSGYRIKWHPDDAEIIENAFKTFQKCPKKSEIEAKFNEDEQLLEIMKQGFSRCYEKVKNTFKKMKK